jgi:hypothetical protein
MRETHSTLMTRSLFAIRATAQCGPQANSSNSFNSAKTKRGCVVDNFTPAQQAIVEAIVALNFNEPAKALDILLEALAESNFALGKDNSNGNASN